MLAAVLARDVSSSLRGCPLALPSACSPHAAEVHARGLGRTCAFRD